jgi:multicomponent Na+:H+ antiporter subunit A
MAGIPVTLGFISKEAGYEALLHSELARGALVLAVVVGASMITFAYSTRFVLGSLFGVHDTAADDAGRDLPRPARGFVGAPLVLTGFTLVAGLAPFLLDPLVSAARGALEPGLGSVHLKLWHGLNPALALSALTIAGGIGIVLVGTQAVNVGAGWVQRVPSGSTVYLALLRGVNRLADRVTGVVQSGSLPVYVGVILLATTTLPAVVLLRGLPEGLLDGGTGDTSTLIGTALLVAIMLVAALTAATIRRRYAAALLLAGVGYAMAGLVVVQGAPDLALTTVAVESLFTVRFMLVLRSLPDSFEQRSTRVGRMFRLTVSAAVGAVVVVFALAAVAERQPALTSSEMIERSHPDGHGRNVVNVILVDFRGFDTLGELTVLAAASIGAVALARAVRRPGRPPASSDGGPA